MKLPTEQQITALYEADGARGVLALLQVLQAREDRAAPSSSHLIDRAAQAYCGDLPEGVRLSPCGDIVIL